MKWFMKQFRCSEKGFTLIELVVVVVILGVLAAVAVPNGGKFIGKGESETYEAELPNIQSGSMVMPTDGDAGELDSAVSAADDMDGVMADGGATIPPLLEEPKPRPPESPEVPNYTITLLSFEPHLSYISDAAFIGKVRNDSSVTLKDMEVVITSYDTHHNIVSIDWRRINRWELPPGETSIFSITFKDYINTVSYGISFELPEGEGNLMLLTGGLAIELPKSAQQQKWGVSMTSQ